MSPNTTASHIMLDALNSEITSQSSCTNSDSVEKKKIKHKSSTKKSKTSKQDDGSSTNTSNNMQLNRNRPSMLEEFNEITSQSSYTSVDSVEKNQIKSKSSPRKSKTSKQDDGISSNTSNTIKLNRNRSSRKRNVLLKIRSKREDTKQKTSERRQQQQHVDSSSPLSYAINDVRRASADNTQQQQYFNSSLRCSSSNQSPTTAVSFLNSSQKQYQHPNSQQQFQHLQSSSTTPSPSPSSVFNHSQNQFMNSYNTPSLNNSNNHSSNDYSYLHTSAGAAVQQQQQQRHRHQPYEVTRRCMELRLVEEGKKALSFSNFFSSFRRRTQSVDSSFSPPPPTPSGVTSKKPDDDAKFDIIRVSWYDGTTTSELQDHVRCAINRKIEKAIMDYRILDLESDEEIVLSPYIPDGSRFLIRYSFPPPVKTIYDYSSTAPYSPSRALSPVNSATELEKLPELDIGPSVESNTTDCNSTTNTESVIEQPQTPELQNKKATIQENINKSTCSTVASATEGGNSIRHTFTESSSGIGGLTPEMHSTVVVKVNTPMQQCKYVIWVIAKCFISFLTVVRICSELYERSPAWTEQLIAHMENVNACAVDRDSLFECVSRGDFSGLMASFVIWITSKTTRQFFLFGFDSVHTLYHCVYEALVSSFCWGCSYMFIRRGLNPDTRTNCLLKYWKDCAYGTLANFFQNFIKTVLKNLLPEEAVTEAFGEAIRATTNKDNKYAIVEILLMPFGFRKMKEKVSANDVMVME